MTSPTCRHCGHPVQADRPCEQCRYIGEWSQGVPIFAYGQALPFHKEAGVYATMAVDAMFRALDSAMGRTH